MQSTPCNGLKWFQLHFGVQLENQLCNLKIELWFLLLVAEHKLIDVVDLLFLSYNILTYLLKYVLFLAGKVNIQGRLHPAFTKLQIIQKKDQMFGLRALRS